MKKTLLFCLALAGTVSCAHTQPTTATTAATDNAKSSGKQEATVASSHVNAPLGAACENDDQCSSGQLCVRSHCTDITKDMAECSILRVHFEFDKAEILDLEKPLLKRAVRCIKAEQGVHFLITGNADERGTEEYNLALGDRRATAVAKYIEWQGINKDQLSTVSYGKNQPLCTEHDEKCWAVNRRSAVKPQDASAPTAKN